MIHLQSRLGRRVLLGALAAILTGTSSRALAPDQLDAQGATSLTFARPAAQGPGTPGFQVISDPTIQPYLVDGVAAYLGTTVLIDLQGNGRPDVVACHEATPPHPPSKVPCRVLRPQPDGSVVDVTRQLFGPGGLPSVISAREYVFGDFNRDGHPDIFIAAQGYDANPFGGETNVLLLSNPDGTYTDRSSTLPQDPDQSHSACAADINGDGYLDIYLGNLGGSPIGPYFLMGHGDGTFTKKITGLPPSMSAGTFNTSTFIIFELFSTSTFVDIDQDGHPDLVLGVMPNPPYVNSIVLFNDGTGDFTKRPRFALPRGTLGGTVPLFTLHFVAPDINRDGWPDLIVLSEAPLTPSGFDLQVLINQGNGTLVDETSRLGPSTARLTGPWYPFIQLADFNGDGWEDLYLPSIFQEDGTSYPRIWLSSGNGAWTAVAPSALPPEFTSTGTLHAVDFDRDGRTDILRLGPGAPGPDIGYNTFLNRTPRTVPSEPIIGAAVAGSGQATISFTPPLAIGASPVTGYTVTCRPGTFAGVVTASGTGSPILVTGLMRGKRYACSVQATSAAGVSLASGSVTVSIAALRAGDFDGDGKSDVAVFRPSNGIWYIKRSSDNVGAFQQWGLAGDVPVPGDYDGDGKTDNAVYRPSTSIWYIQNSSTVTTSFLQWGITGDIPVPGDYDGDGKADAAVFRPSTGIWYVRDLVTNTASFYQWGLSGDIPVAADYDGDLKTDVAVYRPSTGIWYIRNSGNATQSFLQWGLPGDVPVPGDYDGDGKADSAVFRPTTNIWYVRNLTTNTASFYQWGLAGDIQAPGDYDGDGKTDVAVFRPSTGFFYVWYVGSGAFAYYNWGLNGDIPVLKR